MKTLAAILERSNEALILDEIEIPALDYGQVLVKLMCSGICGAQLNEIHAVKGPDKFLPHLLGHEGGGVVEEVGSGVSQVKRGDHVVLHWRKGNGIQARTPQYKWGTKVVNAGWVTTFNTYAIVSENRVTPIPKELDFEIAALMGCALTTAYGLINNDAQLKIGQSLAVFGSGGVGLAIIQAAALVGGYPIIAIDRIPHKLEMARQFGASHVIDSSQQDVAGEIKKIIGSSGVVDVFVETTGNVRLIEQAYKLTASQGRTIMVGVPKAEEDITIHSLPLHFGKVLTGCEGGGTQPSVDIPRYVRLLQARRIDVKKLITHRYPLTEVNKALDMMRSGQAGRCMLQM